MLKRILWIYKPPPVKLTLNRLSMAFKDFFGARRPNAVEMQQPVSGLQEAKMTNAEIFGLLKADAKSISQHQVRYASLLTEYQKNDPNKLKQFPTYLDYMLTRNKELLDQQNDALKARESCIDHSLRLHSKYQAELAHARLPQDIPSPQKLLRMKDDIGSARLLVKEEMAKVDAIEAERQGPTTSEPAQEE